MTSPNHELFVKVLAQIEREPRLWRQGDYTRPTRCGTAHCFAGWAVALALGSHDFLVEVPGHGAKATPDAADILLGTRGWALDGESGLYSGDNTLDDLYRISADILGIDETVLRDKVTAEVSA